MTVEDLMRKAIVGLMSLLSPAWAFACDHGGWMQNGACRLQGVSREFCSQIGGQFQQDRGAGYTVCSYANSPGAQGNRTPRRDDSQPADPRAALDAEVATAVELNNRGRFYDASQRADTAGRTAERLGDLRAAKNLKDFANVLRARHFYEQSLDEANTRVQKQIEGKIAKSARLESLQREHDKLTSAVGELRNLQTPNALDLSFNPAEEEAKWREEKEKVLDKIVELKTELNDELASARLESECTAKGGVLVADLKKWEDDSTDAPKICSVKRIENREVKEATDCLADGRRCDGD